MQEKENQTQGNLENLHTNIQSVQTSPKVPTIRRRYLTKRAEVLRESLEKSSNIEDFIRQIESSEFNATKDELLFSKSLMWMQDNLYQEANISDLAKNLAVSVRKVQRLFSFFVGRTYTSVLLDMRIECAKGYLTQHKNSVGEVAYSVGIKDHAYFTYLFRKATGMTPTEYRLSLIEKHFE